MSTWILDLWGMYVGILFERLVNWVVLNKLCTQNLNEWFVLFFIVFSPRTWTATELYVFLKCSKSNKKTPHIFLWQKSRKSCVNYSNHEKLSLEVVLLRTPFVPNYCSFDFFNLKFDHSFYSKICTKYYFFYCGLLY